MFIMVLEITGRVGGLTSCFGMGAGAAGIKDIMGYCVIALVIGLVLYGGAMLIFAKVRDA